MAALVGRGNDSGSRPTFPPLRGGGPGPSFFEAVVVRGQQLPSGSAHGWSEPAVGCNKWCTDPIRIDSVIFTHLHPLSVKWLPEAGRRAAVAAKAALAHYVAAAWLRKCIAREIVQVGLSDERAEP